MSSNTINSRDRVPISELKTLHRAVRDVDSQLDCPPFPGVSSRRLNPDILKSYLELHPIPVRYMRNGIVCLGGIRLLYAAAHILPPDTEIPVLELGLGVKNGVLIDAYLAERFYLPALFGLRIHDLNRLWHVARRLKGLGDDSNLGLATKSAFGAMYGIDPRRLVTR